MTTQGNKPGFRTRFLLPALCAALLFPGCGQNGDGYVTEGINSVITNEMSEAEGLGKMDRDVRYFMQKWQERGVQISVMRNDSLLYSKGFGLSDEKEGTPMQAGTIMRVASISKLLTAAGIMKLREDGRLKLGDKVFGANGILDDSLFTANIRDKAYFDITVEQLLRHEAGLSTRKGDPLFTTRDIIALNRLDKAPDSRTLVSIAIRRRLGYAPGTGSEYSNLGYLLLSLIIEKLGGTDYGSWMQENILKPAGCMNFRLANNYLEERYPNESRYHMQENDELVPSFTGSADSVVRCYGGNDIRALKGAGAWVCSSAELARFVASIDGKPGIRDILGKKSVEMMTKESEDHKFGLGWNRVSEQDGWLRTGSISGTSAIIAYYPDGECWILITNTHSWRGPKFATTMKNFLWQCKSRYSDKLPRQDLFTLCGD